MLGRQKETDAQKSEQGQKVPDHHQGHGFFAPHAQRPAENEKESVDGQHQYGPEDFGVQQRQAVPDLVGLHRAQKKPDGPEQKAETHMKDRQAVQNFQRGKAVAPAFNLVLFQLAFLNPEGDPDAEAHGEIGKAEKGQNNMGGHASRHEAGVHEGNAVDAGHGGQKGKQENKRQKKRDQDRNRRLDPAENEGRRQRERQDHEDSVDAVQRGESGGNPLPAQGEGLGQKADQKPLEGFLVVERFQGLVIAEGEPASNTVDKGGHGVKNRNHVLRPSTIFDIRRRRSMYNSPPGKATT